MVAARCRKKGNPAGSGDTGNRAQPARQLLLEGRTARGIVADGRHVHVEGQDTVDTKPERHLVQAVETRQQDAGANQERERQRELGGGQAVAQPSLPTRARRRPRLLSKRVDGWNVRETDRGHDAERDGGDHRGHQGKSQHHRVEPHLVQTRDRVATKALEHAHAHPSHGESHQPAEAGEEQAFDEELAEEPSAPGAQRRAGRELMDASRRTCEHQVGHVHARDQEHESDGDQQQTQWAARRRDEILLQRSRINRTQARGWKTVLHHPAQARELGPSLLETGPASQPRNDGQRVVLLIRISGEVVWRARHRIRRRSDLRSAPARSRRPRKARRSGESWNRRSRSRR